MQYRAHPRPTRGHPLAALALAGVLAWTGASAYTLEEFSFTDAAQEHAFRELTSKLRCLVCQNESLAASQSDLAQDLRKEVYAMMKEGKDQQQIIQFLVDRYGDFVLYQPPVKPSTYLLWFGPFLLVGVGAWFLVRALRARGRAPEEGLSDTERARIQQLLAAGEPHDRAP
jgi:cytochrome c-type biogenesis protein CcmH